MDRAARRSSWERRESPAWLRQRVAELNLSRARQACRARLVRRGSVSGLLASLDLTRDDSSRRDLFGVAIVAALIALAIAFGAQRGRRTLAVVARTADVTALTGPVAQYTLFPTSGRLEIASRDSRSRLEVEM